MMDCTTEKKVMRKTRSTSVPWVRSTPTAGTACSCPVSLDSSKAGVSSRWARTK